MMGNGDMVYFYMKSHLLSMSAGRVHMLFLLAMTGSEWYIETTVAMAMAEVASI